MKLFLLLSLLLLPVVGYSQTKAEVAGMLGQLKAKGIFTDEQIKQAEAELKKMDEKDFKKLMEIGKQKINDPEIQKKLKELQQ